MKSKVCLLLLCMLFSQGLSLKCYQCIPTVTGPCTNKEETTCSDQCMTATASTYYNNIEGPDVSIQTCSSQETCQSGSLNLGIIKMSFNTKCCSTDLCNSEKLPAPAKQNPNSRMCYGCYSEDCSAKVLCEGSEDRCISASVQQGGNTTSMKGCVSKNFCVSTGLVSVPGLGVSKVECCEGNLCNGAESFTLSFLLMMVPLLSSFLVY